MTSVIETNIFLFLGRDRLDKELTTAHIQGTQNVQYKRDYTVRSFLVFEF